METLKQVFKLLWKLAELVVFIGACYIVVTTVPMLLLKDLHVIQQAYCLAWITLGFHLIHTIYHHKNVEQDLKKLFDDNEALWLAMIKESDVNKKEKSPEDGNVSIIGDDNNGCCGASDDGSDCNSSGCGCR